jgi:hypothetical protein
VKADYTYISIEQIPGTVKWRVRNRRSGQEIGQVYNWRPWGQYCFFPRGDTVWSESCLKDVIDFIGRLKEEAGDVRRCRVCGCTDDDCSQCIAKTGKACHWVEEDLCSACQPEKKKEPAPAGDNAGKSS